MNIIKKIKNNDDIIDILGTNIISACIQKYEDQQVPSLYPSIPRSLGRIMMAMETQLGLGTMYGILTNTCVNPNYIKIIDKVIQSPDCINEFVEAKVDFARNEIQLIIFLRFC